jgi:transcriptional regulator with XRE-family HTH domain
MKENILNQTELVMANNLKKYRNRLGLRQLDIACKLGFNSTAQLSHWEKGFAVPSLINLFKLAALYNVAPHELYPKLYNSIKATM